MFNGIGVSKQKLSRSGNAGEKKIKDILKGLPRCYIVINDVILKTKTGTTQIDHIIVSPFGIFVIETKNHTGIIYGTDTSQYWTQGLYNGVHKMFFNPVVQNIGHIRQLSKILEIPPNYFSNMVVFSNEEVNLSGVRSSCTGNVNMMINFLNMPRNTILTQDQVVRIGKRIKALNVNSSYFKQKHKKYVQAIQFNR